MYLYSTCAGLLQGSCSSVVRASTAKVGGLGFDSHRLSKLLVCFYADLPPVALPTPPVITIFFTCP